jgi:hypothetical protein
LPGKDAILKDGMHISAGDTAWMLTSTALVFFMMPGLALFYGGLVGAKNVVATMLKSFIAIGPISLRSTCAASTSLSARTTCRWCSSAPASSGLRTW